MPLKKDYLRLKGSCRVRFRLPKSAAPEARQVSLVGEFNNWNPEATPMKRLKNGDFSTHINLRTGSEYQYRYLVNKCTWLNDNCPDRYKFIRDINDSNSVVVV